VGGGERYNILAPQSRNIGKNQQTEDQNSQKMVMQNGGKNKNFPNNQNWNSSLSGPSLLFKSQANQNYAGAKFIELPSPSVLPKPSFHWVPVSFIPSNKKRMIFQVKTLLKVRYKIR
uniref:Proline rich nuclear receptor coactivator 2 n=2 Tax=Rhinopithecus TaxID=542827 RepID=A0A2K6LI05_RHIBE